MMHSFTSSTDHCTHGVLAQFGRLRPIVDPCNPCSDRTAELMDDGYVVWVSSRGMVGNRGDDHLLDGVKHLRPACSTPCRGAARRLGVPVSSVCTLRCNQATNRTMADGAGLTTRCVGNAGSRDSRIALSNFPCTLWYRTRARTIKHFPRSHEHNAPNLYQ